MKKKTEQKEVLIKYLRENADKHLTIQEIKKDLKDKIGMTTIYRIINDLIKQGIVIKIPFENKQGCCYRYNSKIDKCNEHYHLICEKCNKLVHFNSKEMLKVIIEAKKAEQFEINNDRIVFYGICKECKNELGEINE